MDQKSQQGPQQIFRSQNPTEKTGRSLQAEPSEASKTGKSRDCQSKNEFNQPEPKQEQGSVLAALKNVKQKGDAA
jgi:hypothetical protein